jgi:nickel-dependent lactate racemase
MMKWGALGRGLALAEMDDAVLSAIQPNLGKAKRVLLLPPDITRVHSRAGLITRMLFDHFTNAGARVEVMPALGTHLPMSEDEMDLMFENIPHDCFLVHDWRNDVETVGEIPASFVREVSGGSVDYPIAVQLNRRLLSGEYDAIYAIGQVVPHEVAGLSSFSKHIFVGCGGAEMINRTHFLGASVGAENIMGQRNNPVRAVLDRAQAEFADQLPIWYFMTVVGANAGAHQVNGLYFGRTEAFDEAAKLCVQLNIDRVDHPIQKCVVYLDPQEYRSTWLGNKSVYRTRMALAQGAELLVLAPGVHTFGEDAENGRLIRKYGYKGRETVLQCVRENEDLAKNLSVAAHLIHGSSDGKFSITYAVDLNNMDMSEIEAVGYRAARYVDLAKKYNPQTMRPGFQDVDGEEIYYIDNPGLGLWSI